MNELKLVIIPVIMSVVGGFVGLEVALLVVPMDTNIIYFTAFFAIILGCAMIGLVLPLLILFGIDYFKGIKKQT